MAVTKTRNTVHMTANGDAISGKVGILGFLSTGAISVLEGSGGSVVFKSTGAESVMFFVPITVDTPTVAGATGEVIVYTV